MAEFVFWFSFIFVCYTYFGYPALLWLAHFFFSIPIHKEKYKEWPYITLIVAAKNEGKTIEKRILNILQQDYPLDKLEIIVVSDGSSDDTVCIVTAIIAQRNEYSSVIKIIECARAIGKPAALEHGIVQATGEIIVFADARQIFNKEAIRELVENFSDASIGAVSGELHLTHCDSTSLSCEMGAYWEYEKFIRKMESATGSVMGATGAIYAIRKNLYKPLPPETLLDDVLTPIHVMSQGYRVIFEPAAVATDRVSSNVKQEWQRKVRTLTGNWQLLTLTSLQKGFFWKYFSHKICRLLVPFFLVVFFISGWIADGIMYRTSVFLQTVFYFIAFTAHFLNGFRNNPLGKLIYFFCVLNCAVFVGFVLWITGRSSDVWRR